MSTQTQLHQYSISIQLGEKLKLNLWLKHRNCGHVSRSVMCWVFSLGQSHSVVWDQLPLLFIIIIIIISFVILKYNNYNNYHSTITRTAAKPYQDTITRIYLKRTAKKTKTNSLWIVLNYAMWNSLIFYHWYLIPYSVSVSVSVSGFRIPCFSAAVVIIPLCIQLSLH